jgi:hypothetical protein
LDGESLCRSDPGHYYEERTFAIEGRAMMRPQVERPISENELYLKLFVTTSGGW